MGPPKALLFRILALRAIHWTRGRKVVGSNLGSILVNMGERVRHWAGQLVWQSLAQLGFEPLECWCLQPWLVPFREGTIELQQTSGHGGHKVGCSKLALKASGCSGTLVRLAPPRSPT